MSETVRTSLLVEEQVSIDQLWLDDLRQSATWSQDAYEALKVESDRAEAQRTAFLADGTNPDMRATHTDVVETFTEYERLAGFKERLLQDKTLPPDVRQAYRWRVNELLASVYMVDASRTGDMRRFRRFNTFIYGEPNRDIFTATADWFRADAKRALGSEHESVQKAAQAVLDRVPDMGGSRQLLIPDEETFRKVRNAHFAEDGFYPLLLAGAPLPASGLIDPVTGRAVLEAVKANIGAAHYALKKGSWSASNARQEISWPETRWGRSRFVGLGLGHEVGSHVLEAINGFMGRLALAGFGLDRYELGNEGRAVVREQVMYETFEEFAKILRWQDILRRHYAISLGHGTGGQPHTFGNVYEVISAVDRLWERTKDPDNPEQADEKAQKRTLDLLDRVLKGTGGTGGAHLKDIVYLQGNVEAWKMAQEHGPQVIDDGDRAKQDIGNGRHRKVLVANGVIPDRVAEKAE